MYESHREEAIEHAVARNKFFHAATEAYLSGDKASARKWSRQVRSRLVDSEGVVVVVVVVWGEGGGART